MKAGFSRRQVLARTGTLASLATAAAVLPPWVQTSLAADASTRAARRWHQLDVTGDEFVDGQLLRSLAAVWQGMGDIGECLDTTQRIQPGDAPSFFAAWYATAERVAAIAQRSEAAGHRVSAGEAFLRASNYYRTAEFVDHDNPAARKSVECFHSALELLSLPIEPVEIPYEDTTLPGYFFRAATNANRAPILIGFSGFDGTTEEMKSIGEGAARRGINCLLFSGPGQGLVIREKGLPFRHDWEKVVTPVVDFALTRPEVDPGRIVLLGESFGGFLAPRAAAFEPRIRICIANPAVYDFHELSTAYWGAEALAIRRRDPAAFNTLIEQRIEGNLRVRMAMQDSLLKFGAASYAELDDRLIPFDNKDIAKRIRCTVLIMDGTEERVNANQARRFYEALDCPKHYMLFDEESTGSLHCQSGAVALANQRMFDWLQEELARA